MDLLQSNIMNIFRVGYWTVMSLLYVIIINATRTNAKLFSIDHIFVIFKTSPNTRCNLKIGQQTGASWKLARLLGWMDALPRDFDLDWAVCIGCSFYSHVNIYVASLKTWFYCKCREGQDLKAFQIID